MYRTVLTHSSLCCLRHKATFVIFATILMSFSFYPRLFPLGSCNWKYLFTYWYNFSFKKSTQTTDPTAIKMVYNVNLILLNLMTQMFKMSHKNTHWKHKIWSAETRLRTHAIISNKIRCRCSECTWWQTIFDETRQIGCPYITRNYRKLCIGNLPILCCPTQNCWFVLLICLS